MNKPLHTIFAFACCLAAVLLISSGACAQTPVSTPAGLYKNGDYQQGTSTDDGSTVFCAEGSTFTLVSSQTDPVSNQAYSGYVWEEMNTDGTTFSPLTAVSGSPYKATVPTASPGWHIYRVKATTATPAGCEPDPTYYTVYVLPKLKVTPRANKTEAEGISWCSENPAPAGVFTFTGTVAFETEPRKITGKQLTDYTVEDFAKHYAWYRVEGSNPRELVGTDQATYTLDDAAEAGTAKTFGVQLEVKYAITPKRGPAAHIPPMPSTAPEPLRQS